MPRTWANLSLLGKSPPEEKDSQGRAFRESRSEVTNKSGDFGRVENEGERESYKAGSV
jgi:hypothetical protein